MRKNYTIAICDILGFTKLVQQKPLEYVVSSSIGWCRKALLHALQRREFPSGDPTLKELQDHSKLGIAWFSDTILIYTLENTDDCVQMLISTVAWLLFETMFNPDSRLRCGISYGEAHIEQENSIYVGKPIIEAHNLEESQAWSGGALALSAVQRIPETARSGKSSEWFVIPYEVPLHDAVPLQTLALNWTSGGHSGLDMRWSGKHNEPTEEDWAREPRVCEKWQNTNDFHDRVCHMCKPKKYSRIIPI